MTQDYINGWTRGAEDALNGRSSILDTEQVDSDYLRGYKEGYRIGKGFRDGMANAR